MVSLNLVTHFFFLAHLLLGNEPLELLNNHDLSFYIKFSNVYVLPTFLEIVQN